MKRGLYYPLYGLLCICLVCSLAGMIFTFSYLFLAIFVLSGIGCILIANKIFNEQFDEGLYAKDGGEK